MSANVGSFDRFLRIVLGIALILIPFVGGFSIFAGMTAQVISVAIGAVLIVGHYDGVASGPGAGDNRISNAAMLEAISAMYIPILKAFPKVIRPPCVAVPRNTLSPMMNSGRPLVGV